METQNKTFATFSGRAITYGEMEEIKETIAMFGNLSQKELTHTICEHLNWHTPSGTNKWDACAKMLFSFEQKGMITLPAKQIRSKPVPKAIIHSKKTNPAPPISCSLKDLGRIEIVQAKTRSQVQLWNEYTDRYHYLGYKKPFGYRIRYFIRAGEHLLGCLLFSGAARAISSRDKWIGWQPDQRSQNLSWVINNSRFLIFPWVRVKNLASHALARAGRCLQKDWKEKWGFSPALMETFVDPKIYKGTCYQAANWQYVGMTTGKGLVRRNHKYETRPKKIFVYPLMKNFKNQLCRLQPPV